MIKIVPKNKVDYHIRNVKNYLDKTNSEIQQLEEFSVNFGDKKSFSSETKAAIKQLTKFKKTLQAINDKIMPLKL